MAEINLFKQNFGNWYLIFTKPVFSRVEKWMNRFLGLKSQQSSALYNWTFVTLYTLRPP